MVLGIILAVACALASNLAFFYKHRGARAAPRVDVRRPVASARALLRSPWFAVGMGVAVAAWGLHVAALALAPISVVQIVLAAGVVLIAVMAERLFGFSIGPRQWWGLALTAAGLIVIAATLPAPEGVQSSYGVAAMAGFEVGLFGLGAALILGRRAGAPAEHHGVMLAAAAGLLFGVSDVAIKALTGVAQTGGLAGLLSPWLVAAAVASVVAFYASARALQVGEAVSVIAVTGSAANLAGVAGGIVVFGDPLHGDLAGLVLQLAAVIMVVVASALMPGPLRAAAPAAA